MWRFRVGSFAVVLLLTSAVACGGRARGEGLGDAPSVSAGAGGACAAVAGSGAGAAEANSDLCNSCPQASSNRSCPAAEIDIRFTRDALSPRTGVWVEPLQIPDYPAGSLTSMPVIEPSKWDRSPLPAGACVLRIHGLSGGCLRPGALFFGTCASVFDPEAEHVVPFSFYEVSPSCREGVAPGCPTASAWDSRNGSWWYFVARGEDTDLVVCAPECGTIFAGKPGCLRLPDSG